MFSQAENMFSDFPNRMERTGKYHCIFDEQSRIFVPTGKMPELCNIQKWWDFIFLGCWENLNTA